MSGHVFTNQFVQLAGTLLHIRPPWGDSFPCEKDEAPHGYRMNCYSAPKIPQIHSWGGGGTQD